MDDLKLILYVRNFIDGMDDKGQRRHLKKRGWLAYSRKGKLWHLTEAGRQAAERATGRTE